VQGEVDGRCYAVRVFHGAFPVEERMACIAWYMQVLLLVTYFCLVVDNVGDWSGLMEVDAAWMLVGVGILGLMGVFISTRYGITTFDPAIHE
jgi:hypothetical protein